MTCVYILKTHIVCRTNSPPGVKTTYNQPCAHNMPKNQQSHDRLINGYLNLFLFRFHRSTDIAACVYSHHLSTLLIWGQLARVVLFLFYMKYYLIVYFLICKFLSLLVESLFINELKKNKCKYIDCANLSIMYVRSTCIKAKGTIGVAFTSIYLTYTQVGR